MKSWILIMIIATMVVEVSQAQDDSVTWGNCATAGGSIALKVSQEYPEAYKDILVFVIHQMREMKDLPSKEYVFKEINKQCFGFYMIRGYIDEFGINSYQDKIGQFVSEHGVYINGEFFIDDYNLGYATLER
jgi:hypothetical protein